MDDRDARTTDLGLYHYARSYHSAATALKAAKFTATHPDEPRRLLYFHAIELYLKAFLRLKGRSVSQLRSDGHNVRKLASQCRKFGFFFCDEDSDVIRLMTWPEMLRVRYITTGSFRTATLEALARTCASLRQELRVAMRMAGRPVR